MRLAADCDHKCSYGHGCRDELMTSKVAGIAPDRVPEIFAGGYGDA
ncbi:hypothetical protein FAIPA1_380017 [Frankia sp. AiPs1]